MSVGDAVAALVCEHAAARLDYATAGRLERTSRSGVARRTVARTLVAHTLALERGDTATQRMFGAVSMIKHHRATLCHGERVGAALCTLDATATPPTTPYAIARALARHANVTPALVPELFGADVRVARTALARADTRALAAAILVYALGWAFFATRARRWHHDTIGDTYAYMLPCVDARAAYEAVYVRGLELRSPAMDCALYERLAPISVARTPLCEPALRLLEHLDGRVCVSERRVAVTNAWRTSVFERDAAPLLQRLFVEWKPGVAFSLDAWAHGLPKRVRVRRRDSTFTFTCGRHLLASVAAVTLKKRRSLVVHWRERALALDTLAHSSPHNAYGTTRCRLLRLFADTASTALTVA